MLRSPVPVPLLFLFAIAVHIGRSLPYAKDDSLSSMIVNPAKALPNEMTFSPEEIPGLASFVPNDTIDWTKFGCANDSSIWTIIGATALLFFSLLGALLVESDENPGLNYGYAALLLFGYVGIFALFGVVDGIFALFGVVIRQSIWSTIGGCVILAFGLFSVIFWRRKGLMAPNSEALIFIHFLFGYVALLFVGIASYHGAACFNG
uniref:MARVEL domain-containing protein n=1 Tax=Globodera pallida TaxID=36090 RepID=A0A183CGU1_GLOPA